jgi:hypothetical protein
MNYLFVTLKIDFLLDSLNIQQLSILHIGNIRL